MGAGYPMVIDPPAVTLTCLECLLCVINPRDFTLGATRCTMITKVTDNRKSLINCDKKSTDFVTGTLFYPVQVHEHYMHSNCLSLVYIPSIWGLGGVVG